ncbi:ParA family protein [Carboxylicivirga marina]|uniref:ParA family protein n=1 Tax=Carboxylicivirga marina TaxID=2800988 RepID=UPI0025949012|nr:ParA family protein [uncultured Carboxylicivirga sp.]
MKSAKIISLLNQKGGVGKTTSSVSISHALSMKGYKVLLVDLDAQCNASESLGVNSSKVNVYSVLKGQEKLDFINASDNFYLLPASLDLAAFELEMSSEAGREYLLKEALEPVIAHLDFIIIDCSPNLGLLTINALTASEYYICPVLPHHLSITGFSTLLEVVNKIKRRLNEKLKLAGIIMTQFNKHKVLHRETAEVIQSHFEDKLFSTTIPENISLAEAPTSKQSIMDYAPTSKGAIAYRQLTEEIINKLK